MNILDGQKAHAQHKIDTEIANAKHIASVIEGKTFSTAVKAGANGKLFGAVTSSQIADAVAEQYGQKVDKKKINLKTEIKNFGEYEAEIKLYTGISAKVTVEVTEG